MFAGLYLQWPFAVYGVASTELRNSFTKYSSFRAAQRYDTQVQGTWFEPRTETTFLVEVLFLCSYVKSEIVSYNRPVSSPPLSSVFIINSQHLLISSAVHNRCSSYSVV